MKRFDAILLVALFAVICAMLVGCAANKDIIDTCRDGFCR